MMSRSLLLSTFYLHSFILLIEQYIGLLLKGLAIKMSDFDLSQIFNEYISLPIRILILLVIISILSIIFSSENNENYNYDKAVILKIGLFLLIFGISLYPIFGWHIFWIIIYLIGFNIYLRRRK